MVENSLSSPIQQAAFLAAASQRSGDWAFRVASSVLWFAVRQRDRENSNRSSTWLTALHPASLSSWCPRIDAYGRHSFLCKRAPGRATRHHHLNELIARALWAASIPNTKEPQGLCRPDRKRPGGLTLVPWQSGKPLSLWRRQPIGELLWFTALAAREPSSTAEMAASNKTAKYTGLTSDYHFQPIAVESLGTANQSAAHFFTALGKKITQQAGYERKTAFLFQRLSVIVERSNYLLCHGYMWNTISSKLFQPSSTSVWNSNISARGKLAWNNFSKLFYRLIAAHGYFPYMFIRSGYII